MPRITFKQSGAIRNQKFDINLDGSFVGSISTHSDSRHNISEAARFYWYCRVDHEGTRNPRVFVNTASQPPKTLEECKNEAMKALKESHVRTSITTRSH